MKKTNEYNASRFSVAPMMDWTDRHCRYFHRLLTTKALLYTEMVTTGAVIHGDRNRLLGYNDAVHSTAVQLGGSDPDDLARSAKICSEFGYDEINLNIGCPSDRVQSGRFGACLMAEPDLVAECVAAMKNAVSIPVTVKCRIGIDDQNVEEALDKLVDAVLLAGCDGVSVHARKAWLKGLSPKENRDVPPLDYDRVYRLKQRLPDIPLQINGGIRSLEECVQHLTIMDGVMMGREAYHNPSILARVDHEIFGIQRMVTPGQVLDQIEPYIANHLQKGGRLNQITRHMLGLVQAVPGARKYRQILSMQSTQPGAGLEVLRAAKDILPKDVLDSPVLAIAS